MMFMRLKKNKRKNPVAGSVLLVTLATCVILGVLMGSYLSMIKSQHFSVARGQAWNSALVVAEAGGRVTGTDGAPFTSRGGHVLASNGRIHDAMLDVIRTFGRRPGY